MLVNGENLAKLSKSFRTLFLEAYTSAQTSGEKVATFVPSSTSQNVYGWLGNFPRMREWVGDRVINALKAHDFSIRNKAYEATVEVARDDIEDDNLGVYSPLVQQLGQGAKQHPDELLAELLKNGWSQTCYDEQYFFDTDHPVGDGTVANTNGGAGDPWFLCCTKFPIKPLIFQMRRQPQLVSQDDPKANDAAFMRNKYVYGVDYRGNAGYGLWQLAYGSKQTLDATNYETARVAMMSLKNDSGAPLGLVPDLLVVPPSLEGKGRALLLKEKDAAGADNPWYKTADLLVWPFLA